MARATRAEWAKRVERWQDSGLTAKEFAGEMEISPQSLTFWKWKLRKALASTTPGHSKPRAKRCTPKFVQLIAAPETGKTKTGFELIFASGVALRVPDDFDEPSLQRIVRALGGLS